jgi:hypothetical protein
MGEPPVAYADAWLEIHEGYAVPAPGRWPKAMREIVGVARDCGWRPAVGHAEDSGGSPYYSVRLSRGDRWVQLCWHTRDRGPTSYRLFSSLTWNPDSGGYRQGVSLVVVRHVLRED